MILALQFSQLSFEGAVEDGGEEGVEFGGGLGLQALQHGRMAFAPVKRLVIHF